MLSWSEFRQKNGGSFAKYNQYKRDFVVYHEADTNKNHIISTHELDLYAEAWRNGDYFGDRQREKISIDSVTLATKIQWDFDGLYFYFGDLFEGIEEPQEVYNYYSSGVVMVGSSDNINETANGGGHTFLEYYICKPSRVSVRFNGPSKCTAMAAEEILPDGWSAEQYREIWEGVNEDEEQYTGVLREDRIALAHFSQENGRTVVRWGPQEGRFDMRYALINPGGQLPENQQFIGVQSYDGTSHPTLEREISGVFEKRYPDYNDFGVMISDFKMSIPNLDLAADANGDGFSNLVAWLTCGDPKADITELQPEFELVKIDGEIKMRCRYYIAINTSQAGIHFLRSKDLENWKYVIPYSRKRLPQHDHGYALAYESLFSTGGNDYFRIL